MYNIYKAAIVVLRVVNSGSHPDPPPMPFSTTICRFTSHPTSLLRGIYPSPPPPTTSMLYPQLFYKALSCLRGPRRFDVWFAFKTNDHKKQKKKSVEFLITFSVRAYSL